ncbi:hypothetical protein H6B10_18000, partial [Gemmiger formicilis]|uniref:hypothetical protein n=1 Tax=Gemmiger formicilis TaxID=745368 RepID=UPI00195CEA33
FSLSDFRIANVGSFYVKFLYFFRGHRLSALIMDHRAAEGLKHTKMLFIARPHGHRRYWPMVFVERCLGIAAP